MKEAILDTDIISYFLKGDSVVVANVGLYLKNHSNLTISSITYFEILAGLEYKKATTKIKNFKKFVSNCRIINVDKSSLEIAAKKYGELRRNGKTISHTDLIIAGVAISNKLTLVTNNSKHFKSIKGLKIQNWK